MGEDIEFFVLKIADPLLHILTIHADVTYSLSRWLIHCGYA